MGTWTLQNGAGGGEGLQKFSPSSVSHWMRTLSKRAEWSQGAKAQLLALCSLDRREPGQESWGIRVIYSTSSRRQ